MSRLTTWPGLPGIGLLMLVLLSSPVTAALAANAARGDPQELIADTINRLIERLRGSADRIQENQTIAYDISDELVAPHIDFDGIARLVIGKYWRRASEHQQQQLVKEIRALLTRSYVTAMTSYADRIVAHANRISYLPSRFEPGDRKASVRSVIELENGQSVEVDYRLYYKSQWKIYDIRIEGVSLAITYRTSFGETISREGLDSLIAQLAERNRNGEVELPGVGGKGAPVAAEAAPRRPSGSSSR